VKATNLRVVRITRRGWPIQGGAPPPGGCGGPLDGGGGDCGALGVGGFGFWRGLGVLLRRPRRIGVTEGMGGICGRIRDSWLGVGELVMVVVDWC
jgi:hypothetical protein